METPAHETSSAQYGAEQERIVKEQAGGVSPEKEAELAALDKELEGIFWKLDYLKRNGQTEQLRAAHAAQSHIGAMRELLGERGAGSIARDIISKGFFVWVECDPSDFGHLAVKLASDNPEGSVQELAVFEDLFGVFESDPYPTKESIKNAFFAARDRFASAQHRKHAKALKDMETDGMVH